MTFRDLPRNIRELSLEDPVLAADVVDLCCFSSARQDDIVAVLICDSQGRMVQPVLVDGVPWAASAEHRLQTFEPLMSAIAGADGAVVVAFARVGSLVTDADRRWHQSAIDACAKAGVRLFGTYVAAPGRVVRLPDPTFLSAAG